jgi:hypothetical protein
VHPCMVRLGRAALQVQPDQDASEVPQSQAGPRIALSIVDPEDPYRYLEVRGVVERIEEDPELTFIDSMAKKYRGDDEYKNHRPSDERVVVIVQPELTTEKDG